MKLTVQALRNKLTAACDAGYGGKSVVIFTEHGKAGHFVSDAAHRGELLGDHFILHAAPADAEPASETEEAPAPTAPTKHAKGEHTRKEK